MYCSGVKRGNARNHSPVPASEVRTIQLPPTVARVNGVGLSSHAPHPHAALLFFDFLLTDAQAIFAGREIFPTNEKVRRVTDELKLSFVDPATMMDEGGKWEKLFNEIFVRPPK